MLSIFYLLQQAVISTNADGTINAPSNFEPGPAKFHEVVPDVWREIGLAWLVCWTLVLLPVLNTQLDVCNASLDAVIRTL